MKNLKLVLALLITAMSFGQVGIGTTTPEAALDVSSTTTGFLPPRVSLTATNVDLPVVNPQGGLLAIGTMVYNTNTTIGTYGVSQGIYHWDGIKWVSAFQKSFSQEYKQNASTTTTSTSTFINIPSLTGLTFTAPYDGKYRFVFNGYLGAEEVDDITTDIRASDDISGYAAIGFVEGYFRLKVEGVDYDKYNHSESYYRSDTGTDGSGGTNYLYLFNEITITLDVQFTAGQVVNIECQYSGEGDDNILGGTHIIGEILGNLGNPCQLNIMYIGQ